MERIRNKNNTFCICSYIFLFLHWRLLFMDCNTLLRSNKIPFDILRTLVWLPRAFLKTASFACPVPQVNTSHKIYRIIPDLFNIYWIHQVWKVRNERNPTIHRYCWSFRKSRDALKNRLIFTNILKKDNLLSSASASIIRWFCFSFNYSRTWTMSAREHSHPYTGSQKEWKLSDISVSCRNWLDLGCLIDLSRILM